MQVMHTDQHSQKEILLGQSGQTEGFKVSDDPMLMSTLSTGFYSNPLRTMIQEVMFNAWDAHKESGLENTPIDVYINENSGITFRDYGFGIPEELMGDVYCTYGGSTKRADKRQTGGFGLGCKSPWSYTESFTVTSYHKGSKCMYLMSRVSDDADGKPGKTLLMRAETQESGIAVAIPLEDYDHKNAKKALEDVMYLSGVKARIHYMDDEAVIVESENLDSAQYAIDKREDHHRTRAVYAVYGGVRYKIPERDEYSTEMEFFNTINTIGSFFIGFAPDTLTPLPNREGLNVNRKTKENIRIGLEMCMESLSEGFEPLLHAYFRSRFDHYKSLGLQAHFAMYHVLTSVRSGDDILFLKKFRTIMTPLTPNNISEDVWRIGLDLLVNSLNKFVNLVGEKKTLSIIGHHFIRVYPEHKDLMFSLLKAQTSNLFNHGNHRLVEQIICESGVQAKQLSKLFEFEKQMKIVFQGDKALSTNNLRVKTYSDKWVEMVRHRNAPRGLAKRYAMHSTRKVGTKVKDPVVNFEDPTRIWDTSSGEEVISPFMDDKIILAKTVTALNDTPFNMKKLFSTSGEVWPNSYHYSSGINYDIIPAYVVHGRKGGYETAKGILESLGFEVIEADEPEKAKYYAQVGSTKPIIKQYRYVNTDHAASWQADEIDPDDEDYDPIKDRVPLTEPTHYLYVKSSLINNDYGRDYDCPKPRFVRRMLTLYPDTAMVNSVAQAEILDKLGVKKFETAVDDWVSSLTSKVYRLRNLVRVNRVTETSSIPEQMLSNRTIQKAMGIAEIKKDDKDFWFEMSLISDISGSRYHPIQETKRSLNNALNQVWKSDPMKTKIEGAINASNIFSESSLRSEWISIQDPNDGKRQEKLAQNISRFIRGTV